MPNYLVLKLCLSFTRHTCRNVLLDLYHIVPNKKGLKTAHGCSKIQFPFYLMTYKREVDQ